MAASASRKARPEGGPDAAAPSRPGRSRKAVAPSPAPAAARPSGERQATVHEAKTHLSRLLAEVEAGGTVVITRRGKPVAKLEAVRHRPKRIFGSMKGQFEIDDSFFDPLPDEELRLWGEL